jgi:hypothetical protein
MMGRLTGRDGYDAKEAGTATNRAAGRCAMAGRLIGHDGYDAKESRGPLRQDGQADWPLAALAVIVLQAAAPGRAG